MKRFFSLLLIITFASHFGTIHTFAQKKAKRKEAVVIELSIPGREETIKAEMSVNQTPKFENSIQGGGSCGDCDEFQTPDYEFKATAFKMNKNKTKVSFKIKIGDECKTSWVFTVYRNRKTKLQLQCGVSLIAYFGFESEEAN
jgi:hypothetical protein